VEKSKEILSKYWGFNKFRSFQEEIVDSTLYGHDTFAVLPTGGGKSICFQVPGIALEGITIVISPLIALMQDQVNNLKKRGISAELLTGAMSYREIDITLDNAKFGAIKFLYTSPERLKSPIFIERFKQMKVSLIAIDEAHCISQWGHDFRPSYKEISVLRTYHPETPMIALTASATPIVQEDIIKLLKLKDPKIFIGNVERKNIQYSVVPIENKLNEILEFCKKNKNESGIIYCKTRKSVKDLTIQLRAQNISAGMYHGGLSSEDRTYMLNQWMGGGLTIMVATNAFGMGIDKPDVRFVLHYEFPANLEAYYQEAGRAGRDENIAQAIAYWEPNDIHLMKDQFEAKYPEKLTIKNVYNSVCNYLKIAIGSGQGESYSFNIKSFAATFNFSISETYNSLKILALNGNLSFIENSFLPTRLKFAIGNSALYKFQVSNEKYNALITLISRSYPGVFERFVSIDEIEFSKRLKFSKIELRNQLKFLEEFGIIEINYQSDLPQIYFTEERKTDQNFSLSFEVYENRKNIEFDKLQNTIEYLTSNNCRSELISAYFGNSTSKCKQCDVCKAELTENYTHEELKSIILENLPNNQRFFQEKVKMNRLSVQKALQDLILSEKIIKKEGMYFKN